MLNKLKLKLLIFIAHIVYFTGMKSNFIALGLSGIADEEHDKNEKAKEAFIKAENNQKTHKSIVIKTDGLMAISFNMKCENAIWFDRWIFFPIMKWVLMTWLKWNIKGGEITFTYRENSHG
ncbi:MAG: hypothetical protein ABFD63_01770 [Smithella sp.]